MHPSDPQYDLRHTYATHLLAEGAPITYVAAQLGHAKATTTLAHYAHWIPEDNKGWVDRLAARRAAEAEKFGTKVGTKRDRRLRVLRNCLNWLEPGAGVEPATY